MLTTWQRLDMVNDEVNCSIIDMNIICFFFMIKNGLEGTNNRVIVMHAIEVKTIL